MSKGDKIQRIAGYILFFVGIIALIIGIVCIKKINELDSAYESEYEIWRQKFLLGQESIATQPVKTFSMFEILCPVGFFVGITLLIFGVVLFILSFTKADEENKGNFDDSREYTSVKEFVGLDGNSNVINKNSKEDNSTADKKAFSYCIYCGKKIDSNLSKCPHCGAIKD